MRHVLDPSIDETSDQSQKLSEFLKEGLGSEEARAARSRYLVFRFLYWYFSKVHSL